MLHNNRAIMPQICMVLVSKLHSWNVTKMISSQQKSEHLSMR